MDSKSPPIPRHWPSLLTPRLVVSVAGNDNPVTRQFPALPVGPRFMLMGFGLAAGLFPGLNSPLYFSFHLFPLFLGFSLPSLLRNGFLYLFFPFPLLLYHNRFKIFCQQYFFFFLLFFYFFSLLLIMHLFCIVYIFFDRSLRVYTYLYLVLCMVILPPGGYYTNVWSSLNPSMHDRFFQGC